VESWCYALGATGPGKCRCARPAGTVVSRARGYRCCERRFVKSHIGYDLTDENRLDLSHHIFPAGSMKTESGSAKPVLAMGGFVERSCRRRSRRCRRGTVPGEGWPDAQGQQHGDDSRRGCSRISPTRQTVGATWVIVAIIKYRAMASTQVLSSCSQPRPSQVCPARRGRNGQRGEGYVPCLGATALRPFGRGLAARCAENAGAVFERTMTGGLVVLPAPVTGVDAHPGTARRRANCRQPTGRARLTEFLRQGGRLPAQNLLGKNDRKSRQSVWRPIAHGSRSGRHVEQNRGFGARTGVDADADCVSVCSAVTEAQRPTGGARLQLPKRRID